MFAKNKKSIVIYVKIKIIMKNTKKSRCLCSVLLMALVFTIALSPVFSADNNRENEKPVYKLHYKFPLTITNSYKMVENTSVTRIYKDSTVLKYDREVNLFFSIKQVEPTKDDFVTVHVALDSLHYTIKDGDAVFEFNSQNEAQGSIAFDDLNDYLIPLSKEFDMTYSPYGEVIKTEGGNLDDLIRYIKKATQSQMDSSDQKYWLDMLSVDRLQYLSDPKKLSLPNVPVTKDSVWLSKPWLCIDGIYFNDTVSTKISNVVPNYFDIEAKFNKFNVVPGDYKFYGIKDITGSIIESNAKGNIKLSIGPKGTLEGSEANFNVELKAKIRKEVMSEKIDYNCKWLLMGQFEY